MLSLLQKYQEVALSWKFFIVRANFLDQNHAHLVHNYLWLQNVKSIDGDVKNIVEKDGPGTSFDYYTCF